MNTNTYEKIINEAWNNKSQINSKSDKKILNAITETIEFLGKEGRDEMQKLANEALKEYVDFQPSTSIHDGISHFIKWYKSYYKIK